MADYDDTNRGVLFRNDRKDKDSQPDYTGRINVKGTEQQISAWINESSKGIKYLSIRCSDPMSRDDAPVQQAAPAATASPSASALDDVIPF